MHCGPPNQYFGWAMADPAHPAAPTLHELPVELTLETCRLRLRSNEIATLNKRTWSVAVMESWPSCSWQPCRSKRTVSTVQWSHCPSSASFIAVFQTVNHRTSVQLLQLPPHWENALTDNVVSASSVNPFKRHLKTRQHSFSSNHSVCTWVDIYVTVSTLVTAAML